MKTKTFSEFVTDDMVIRLLAKERGKYAVKFSKQGKNLKKTGSRKCTDPASKTKEKDPLYEELSSMLPPRDRWVNAGSFRRPEKPEENGPAKWTHQRRIAAARAYVSVCKLRREEPDAEWAKKLDGFIGRIRSVVDGTLPVNVAPPEIKPLYKEDDPESGDRIFRPICVYRDLETKILLALTYKYIVTTFDDCFHRKMLFMRTVRRDRNRQWYMPNYIDAIRLTSAYRNAHADGKIFVGECDIQKFYDIMNHDDIVECFKEIYAVKAAKDKIDPSVFAPVTRILEAYLSSFDYYHNIMGLNDPDNPVWKLVRLPKKKKQGGTAEKPVCRFKWVSDGKFIGSGCYDEESLGRAKAEGKLGIPQGGALSGIIVNVVMQSIDKGIVGGKDPDRLFIRYCDDILLMHTDRKKCEEYLDYYYEALKAHKLVPHPRRDVSEFKNGVRTKHGFWKAKSKNVFKWGRGDGDASDWVGFVGYEMRRTGEIRHRKDKIDSETKRIAHAYYRAFYGNKEKKEDNLTVFNGLGERFESDPVRTRDRYSMAQAKRLDNYLLKKYNKAARHLGVAPAKEEDLTIYGDAFA